MNTETLKFANAFAGVTLLAALTVAVIAGEARSNLHPSIMHKVISAPGISASLTIDTKRLIQVKNLERLDTAFDAVRDLPVHVDASLSKRRLAAAQKEKVAE